MNIRLIRFIAKRFSQSNRRQRFLNFARLVALISVMLGSMALIISLAVLDGFDSMLRENAVKFTSHIVVSTYRNAPLPDYRETISTVKNWVPEVKSIAPVIEREGLVRSRAYVEGIMIRGILPEFDITNLKDNIISGTFGFSSDTAKEIIIGKRLADKLGVDVDSSIVLYAIKDMKGNELSYPEIEKFKVKGIYRTGMVKYDDIIAYIPFFKAGKMFQLPQYSATSFDVMLNDINQVPEVRKKIEDVLGFPYYTLTVFELHSSIFAWIELQKAPIPLVLGLISIVAVLNIITILLVTVVEKTRSIGILRTLGMNNRGIISIFVAQGVTIGLAGTLTGCGIGLLLCWLQQHFGLIRLQGDIYYLDVLPVHISIVHYEIVIAVSLALSFLATLIPAWVAVKVSPIRAIRFK